MTPNVQTYADLLAAPEGGRIELHDGQLHTQPQPKARHQAASSRLNRRIGAPFDDGINGPGDWWIIAEPEVHFQFNTLVRVPDLAGWYRSRMPSLPEDQKFTVIPDWICEVLSPATVQTDRGVKMTLYAQHNVRWVWLLDPDTEILETYQNLDGHWRLNATFVGEDTVNADPFLGACFTVSSLFRY